MRVLGLDVGDRRIGVALSDPLGLTAQQLTVVARKRPTADVEAIARLVGDHQVERVIVGWPLTLRGATGPQARKVAGLVDLLRRRLKVPVELVDERLTTVQGQRTLTAMGVPLKKQKHVIDRVAAQLILQHHLDAQRR